MTNNKTRGPYVAEVYGSLDLTVSVSNLAEAKKLAESYGDTARSCLVTDKKGRTVAYYHQIGGKWFRAEA